MVLPLFFFFCKLININMGKYFLKLIDKHFNQNNILHKIFNKKTLKISLSCTKNFFKIINNHNNEIIRKYHDRTNNNNNKPHRNELPTSENQNATRPNNAQPSNPKETLSQEQNINLENVNRIMQSEKSNLPSLKNIEWRTLKIENFYQQLRGSHAKTYQQPDAKETERFWTKIWRPKNITKRLNG